MGAFHVVALRGNGRQAEEGIGVFRIAAKYPFIGAFRAVESSGLQCVVGLLERLVRSGLAAREAELATRFGL